MTNDQSTPKPPLEIANLFARVGADVEQFSAGMQAVDKDLAMKAIAELGLDLTLKVTQDKTDSDS